MDQILFEFELTNEERIILETLQNCKGKQNAMLGQTIAELTGINYYEVRQTVSGLINHHDKLIGSCNRGYYLIEDPDEVAEVYSSLRRRGIAILYRASRIKKISVVEVFGQGVLNESSK